MNSIRDRIVLVDHMSMTLQDSSGAPAKAIWVTCTKSLTSDDVYTTGISN